MCGITARQKLKTPVRLMAIFLCHCSSVCSQMGAEGPAMPALFTRMSMRPLRLSSSSTASPTSFALDTSARTANEPFPMAPPTRRAPARSRSTIAIVAPAPAKRCAIASPIPVAAPVTIPVCPVKSKLTISKFTASVALPHVSPFHPMVRRHRILPEIFFFRRPPLASEKLAHDIQFHLERRPQIAIRPIAAIEQPVFSENPPQLIEGLSVKIKIRRNSTIFPPQHFRNFDVHLRPLAQLLQIRQRMQLRQMIDDHAEPGNLIRHPNHRLQERCIRIRSIEHQPRIGQRLQPRNKFRF